MKFRKWLSLFGPLARLQHSPPKFGRARDPLVPSELRLTEPAKEGKPPAPLKTQPLRAYPL